MEVASPPVVFLRNCSTNPKIQECNRTLQQVVHLYDDIVSEFESLHVDLEASKLQCTILKEKNESRCEHCSSMKKDIDSKDKIIQLVAAAVTRLDETKNLNIIQEIFQILFSSGNGPLTPPKDSSQDEIKNKIKKELNTVNPEDITPNVSIREESMSEIEGTPGRTSPIIHSKKLISRSVLEKSGREKTKCSPSWKTPEHKLVKLSPSGGSGRGRWRQQRLQVTSQKSGRVIDLTSSPVLTNMDDHNGSSIIKMEPLDNDDTILPSPTSTLAKPDFSNKLKLSSCTKQSPVKFKKPTDALRLKRGSGVAVKTEVEDPDVTDIELSINLLNQNRFKNSPCKTKQTMSNPTKCEDETRLDVLDIENHTPVKCNNVDMEESVNLLNPFKFAALKEEDPSQTFTEPSEHYMNQETNVSLSLLKHIDKIETDAQAKHARDMNSPSKRPLVENVNINNVPTQVESQILQTKPTKSTDKGKPELVEPIYKEPTVRKKAEKRALPGWSCDECKNFYSELYADNEEMLLKLMSECSRHRSKRAPPSRRTPPRFWDVRWTVPDDTETFNKLNNAS